jgi:hypothetical protein
MSELVKSSGNEVTKTEQQNVNPVSLIQLAIEKGMDITAMERLFDMQQRWEKSESIKAFNKAFADFQYNCPTIPRTAYQNTRFNSSSLDDIAKHVKEPLMKNGLSYRFKQVPEGDLLHITCIIQHEMGHCEETTLTAARDKSGGKNDIQGLGSTNAYLFRYTLKAALGIADAECEDGGESAPNSKKYYPQESFDKNKENWAAMILEGKATPNKIINKIFKSGSFLTNEQIKILNGITENIK